MRHAYISVIYAESTAHVTSIKDNLYNNHEVYRHKGMGIIVGVYPRTDKIQKEVRLQHQSLNPAPISFHDQYFSQSKPIERTGWEDLRKKLDIRYHI
jgi:hypothetical protein